MKGNSLRSKEEKNQLQSNPMAQKTPKDQESSGRQPGNEMVMKKEVKEIKMAAKIKWIVIMDLGYS